MGQEKPPSKGQRSKVGADLCDEKGQARATPPSLPGCLHLTLKAVRSL